MNQKKQIIEALRQFIGQRSGIDYRNYNDRANLMQDYRPIVKHGKQARELLRIVELSDCMTPELIIEEAKHTFSGRLSIIDKGDKVAVDYCTGQYFAVEYRKAACAVLGGVIRAAYGPSYGNYDKWQKYARKAYGRGLASWM